MTSHRAKYLLNSINERINSMRPDGGTHEQNARLADERQAEIDRQDAHTLEASNSMLEKINIRRLYQENQRQNERFDDKKNRQSERTFERMLARSRERQYTNRGY